MFEPLFAAIDRMDAPAFAAFLSPHCDFRFGNLPVVQGRAGTEHFVARFFDSIGGIAHQVDAAWQVPGGYVAHGFVTYTRKDGSQLRVPFANVFRLDAGGIADYLIFVDNSTLYSG